jgi:hypothetical protein
MRLYAQQAKNKDLEADAFEIRLQAERRLGEMMASGRGDRVGHGGDRKSRVENGPLKPTLAEAGIDKHLADRARKLNALSKENFENLITEGRKDARRSAERAIFSQISRQEKHQKIATATERAQLLAHVGPFPLIYADPPWKWGHFGEADKENEAGKGRTPDQHYPTLTYDEIEQFDISPRPDRPVQTWKTFVRNHMEGIAAIDLFVVPTIAFEHRLLGPDNATKHSFRSWV